MSGRGSGRPKPEQRQRAIDLRAAGQTLAQIGQRLGITRQAVEYLLRGQTPPPPARCRTCKAALPEGATQTRGALCLPCLQRRTDATFAQRLRGCRVAAGLTRGQLATQIGVTEDTVGRYENGVAMPRRELREALALVLGSELAALLYGAPAVSGEEKADGD
jgi:transcriptional regulator with XRE-family HTH domain